MSPRGVAGKGRRRAGGRAREAGPRRAGRLPLLPAVGRRRVSKRRLPLLLAAFRRRRLVMAVVLAVTLLFVLGILLGFQLPSSPSR